MEDKAWTEVAERLARIESKLDNYEALRDKADKAYSMSFNNMKTIAEMKANAKWAWGYMIGLGIAIVTTYILDK